jgi:hypothetical protein
VIKTLEKEKFEEKDKDTLEKPSKTSRSEKKRRDRKSDGLINITPRKTDKKNIILTPSLGEVCLEISGKVDKEKEIRSSLNEMVQTGSDLGEPPSSDNESEQKADEKDKEKLISIQEGGYDAKFSIIQNDDFTFEIIGGKIKEVESEKKDKIVDGIQKEEKIPKVSEEEKETKEITSKPKDILPKKDEKTHKIDEPIEKEKQEKKEEDKTAKHLEKEKEPEIIKLKEKEELPKVIEPKEKDKEPKDKDDEISKEELKEEEPEEEKPEERKETPIKEVIKEVHKFVEEPTFVRNEEFIIESVKIKESEKTKEEPEKEVKETKKRLK